MVKRRGLKFAVCYEDRVLKAMAERKKLTPAQAVEHGKAHLRFCEENWFKEPSYVTWQGKPLLLVFGPDYLNPTQWEAVFSGMRPPPAFFTLHERRPPAIGSFAWPPMWAAKDGVLDAKGLDAYLDRFYGQDGRRSAAPSPASTTSTSRRASSRPTAISILATARHSDTPWGGPWLRGAPWSRSPPGTTSARAPASSRPVSMATATWRRSRTPDADLPTSLSPFDRMTSGFRSVFINFASGRPVVPGAEGPR